MFKFFKNLTRRHESTTQDTPLPHVSSETKPSNSLTSTPEITKELAIEKDVEPTHIVSNKTTLEIDITSDKHPNSNISTSKQNESWLKRLRSGMAKTRVGMSRLFTGVKIEEAVYEELETALLMADAGVEATQYLLDELRKKVRAEKLVNGSDVRLALREILLNLLLPLQQAFTIGLSTPFVVMLVGVNGAGKTTTIGKLTKHLLDYKQSVLLAAGDTFRAAACDQLAMWGARNGVTVYQRPEADPASVVFEAIKMASSQKTDIVLADTAGRLSTQNHLMEELKKIKRVIGKAQAGAPHETLLVIDANNGQNALAQVKAFDDVLNLSGLILTKLDGTAKGGILAAIARHKPIPVYFIGLGEKLTDLQPFNAQDFVDAWLEN